MDIITYILSKKYTDASLDGIGAVKGAPCRISKIEPVEGGNKITFAWTSNSGVESTSTLIVKDGEQGNGIAKIEKIKTVDLVDTYRMTFDDGSTFDYEVTNGSSSGSGKIDIIKVNGTELPIIDKTVDIEIPEYIYIGNTEPTDENIVLWVNPDEIGGDGSEVAISKAEGNALEKKQDGLYVAEGAVKISKEEANIIEQKSDGIFATINSQDEKTVDTVLDIVKNNVETEDLNFSVFFN